MTVLMASQGLFVNCGKRPENVVTHFQSLSQSVIHSDNCYIGRHLYCESHIVEEISSLTKLMQAKWFIIQDVIMNNTHSLSISDVFNGRQFINEAFKGIIKCLMLCDDPNRKIQLVQDILKYVKIFFRTVVPICKLDNNIVLKVISTINMNDCFHQYLHTYLDIQYYKLVTYGLCELGSEDLKEELVLLLKDLTKLCKVYFKKSPQSSETVFSCSCIKYFWLILQLLLETSFRNNQLFWEMVNNVLSAEEPMFTLFLLKDIAFLQCYNRSFENEEVRSSRIIPNFAFLNQKIQETLQQANSETLLRCFQTIEPLLNSLWLKEESLDIFSTIWTFYSKRLNVSNRNAINISPYELNETLDIILWSPKDSKEDFVMYISLLIAHLREFPLHFNKIKGKIFTHTQGTNKIKSLTEIGVIHVVLLYMALGSLNHDAIESKLNNVLKEITDERYASLVWNIYCGLILKYVRDGRSIEKIAPQFVGKLQKASTDQHSSHLIKNFFLNFEKVIENSMNMRLSQWLLLDNWLPKYHAVCYYADLTKSLEVISLLLTKCSEPECWEFWEAKFQYFVYPSLKHLASCSTPPDIIGNIAGRLCLVSNSLESDAIKFFNSEVISPKLSVEFLDVILENYPKKFILTHEQESIVVQSWMKVCILSSDSQCEFTRKVMKLELFPQDLKQHLNAALDPCINFIEYLGTDPKQCSRNPNLIKLVTCAFGNLDKILNPYLEKPPNEEVILKIYNIMSLIFLKCGSLIYSPNRPNTPLDRLVKILLLPDDFVLRKKNPHDFVLNALKNTWHIFFEALRNLNLNTHLETMIVRYIPEFTTLDNPIIKCLEKDHLAPFVLQKISKLYFGRPPYKESEKNTNKVIKILSDFVESTTSMNSIQLIITNSLSNIFTAIIYNPKKNKDDPLSRAQINLVKTISTSPFCNQCKTEIKEAIVKITDATIGFEYKNYFELMINLVKYLPDDVKDCLDYIKEKIREVERKRGVGFDQSLRMQFDRLKQAFKN